ncbi:sugar phosphate nucleotidyltransferase [Caulobacter sp. DWP3-1-3b2]|uniref:sugar phosphate nucleotidyltransferase n=1 Tax=Caulobacter sp. DWP3-1-3b2 TaxID=2804643 RepID=UPI003CF8C3D9
MITQAVVLVGGLGTRLGALTKETPKPLLEVGGQPFLYWLLRELRRHGVSDVLLLAGFRAERLQSLSEAFLGVRLVVEPEPLGTGGALRHAADLLDERFFFLNGDSFFDVNLWALALDSDQGLATLALRPVENVSRYGPAVLEGDRIVRFAERPETDGPGLINGGVAVLSRAILNYLPAAGPASIERQVYPRLAKQGLLRGKAYERPFIDIGVPEDFAQAQDFIPNQTRRGAVVFEYDSVLKVEDVHQSERTQWVTGAIAAIRAVNDAGLFAFVAADPGGATLGPGDEAACDARHVWMNAQLKAQGAHIDAFACSSHPSMIMRLLEQFPVIRERVVMVGDQPTTPAAAEAAGIPGVRFEGADLEDFLRPWIVRLAALEA